MRVGSLDVGSKPLPLCRIQAIGWLDWGRSLAICLVEYVQTGMVEPVDVLLDPRAQRMVGVPDGLACASDTKA